MQKCPSKWICPAQLSKYCSNQISSSFQRTGSHWGNFQAKFLFVFLDVCPLSFLENSCPPQHPPHIQFHSLCPQSGPLIDMQTLKLECLREREDVIFVFLSLGYLNTITSRWLKTVWFGHTGGGKPREAGLRSHVQLAQTDISRGRAATEAQLGELTSVERARLQQLVTRVKKGLSPRFSTI